MRTYFTLKNVRTLKDKAVIVRNLNRIMNLVILDFDLDNGTITLLYDSKSALLHAKRELKCIGFPVIDVLPEKEQKPEREMQENGPQEDRSTQL